MAIIGNKTNTALKQGKAEVEVTSTEIVAANHPERNGIEIVNQSGGKVWLGFGKAAVESEGMYLAPGGGSWNGEVSKMVWTGSVFGIASAAKSIVTFVET